MDLIYQLVLITGAINGIAFFIIFLLLTLFFEVDIIIANRK